MTMQTPEPSVATEEGRGIRLSGGAIATGTGIGALAAFMVQNTDDVRVEFLVWDFTLAVWFLTLSSATIARIIRLGRGSSASPR